jgi:ADP-heptose:LPS heptosyltransferase
VDHWKLSRARASFIARWKTTRRTAGLALREIRDARYDAAIDTAAYYPNFARIVWRAGIPTRVGFTSGGEGPLYTHPVPWTEGRHAARDALALLRELAPGYDDGGDLSYDLSAVAPDGRARVEALLARAGTRPGDYVVLHAGAGHPRKEWPIDRWRSVARSLADAGVPLVLTGAGSEQLRAADELERAVPEALNLSDRLTWPEFRAVIAGARLLLSVDTVAMHLAGASGVPCVALMTGIDRPERWNPLGGHATILTAPVPCAPCFRSRGCGEMSCVRDIDVDRVLAAARPHLPP